MYVCVYFLNIKTKFGTIDSNQLKALEVLLKFCIVGISKIFVLALNFEYFEHTLGNAKRAVTTVDGLIKSVARPFGSLIIVIVTRVLCYVAFVSFALTYLHIYVYIHMCGSSYVCLVRPTLCSQALPDI